MATHEKLSNKTQSLPLLKRCLGYFTSYKLRIFLAVIGMLMAASMEAATAYIAKPAFDDGLAQKNMDALLWVAIAAASVLTIKGAGRYIQNYFMRYCALKVLETLRNELYDKMICLPMKFFEKEQIGSLMSRIIQDVMLIRASLPSAVMLARQLLTVVGLVGYTFYLDWRLACWALLGLPVAVVPIAIFGRKLRKLGRKNQVKLADISIFLQEVFSGIRVVKAFHTEKTEGKNFRKENSRLVRIAIKEVILSELSSPVMDMVGGIGAAIVLLAGGMRVVDGAMTVGELVSFLTALGLLYSPVKKLNSAYMDIQRALAGAERVFEILDSPTISIESSGPDSLSKNLETVKFQNVTFQYDGCDTPALNGVNLTVQAGEKIAIVGPSGAGKTTFVNVIPRFYEQQQGTIRINGKDTREYSLESLRHNVAIVSQDTFLFNLSIRENIAYGQTDISQQAIEAAAKSAFAHDFITNLAEGYDTVIGERGARLSGGQKQRLTIARALVKNAPLLILDEATSALDSESEHIVQKALENLMKERTSIVIAHRLSTILSADRILVMNEGKVVAEGSHAELLNNNELYAKLYNMQFQTPKSLDAGTCPFPKEISVGV